MTISISKKKSESFDRKASLVNMNYLKAQVAASKLETKDMVNGKALSSEQTNSHERL